MTVRWDGSRITRASVESTRPRGPARLLIGQRVERALSVLPRLFAICGRAHAIAGALATDNARGVTEAAAAGTRRRQLAAEAVHEHLWRALLDWPAALGERPDVAAFAAVRGSLVGDALDWPSVRQRVRELLGRQVLGSEAGCWRRAMDRGGLDDWLRAAPTPPARLLARLRDDADSFAPRRVSVLPPAPGEAFAIAIARRLDADDAFAAAPSWEASPRETGPVSRHADDPLLRKLGAGDPPALPRFLARLLALESLTSRDDPEVTMGAVALPGRSDRSEAAAQSSGVVAGDQRAHTVDDRRHGAGAGNGTGDAVAWVDTARGLLMHRASLVDGVVRRYDIVAPTEWNFHPCGALATELPGLRAADEPSLRRRVALLVQSLDPCVGFGVEVGHA